MSVTIRPASAGDAAQLHALAAQTFGLACPPGTSAEDIETFVATRLSEKHFDTYLADPGRILLVAEDDGVPAGYAMLVRGPIEDPDVRAVVDQDTSVELSKFYVLADRHGSGVAAVLMAAALEAAAGTGAATCWLGVNQQNVRAAKFYAKHGFEVAGVKRFQVGSEWHDDHIRVRPLSRE